MQGHPTCIYFIKHCTIQCTLYSVLYTALYTEHSIASCQSALLTFLVSWHTPPPLSCFLYTIPNTTLCTLLNHIHYTVLYTRLYTVLYTTFYTVIFTVLYTIVSTQAKVTGWYDLMHKDSIRIPFLHLGLFDEHYSVQYNVHYTLHCTV